MVPLNNAVVNFGLDVKALSSVHQAMDLLSLSLPTSYCCQLSRSRTLIIKGHRIFFGFGQSARYFESCDRLKNLCR